MLKLYFREKNDDERRGGEEEGRERTGKAERSRR
jgi:hypothetical protein